MSIELEGEYLPEDPVSSSNMASGKPDQGRPVADAIAGEEAQATPDGWGVVKAVAREVVETIVLALVLIFLIQLVVRNFRVDGHSMEPNLQHGQYLMVDKISYKLPFKLRPPQRGDVIVFASPTHQNKNFVKRIIALSGEKIELKNGDIYINDELLPNIYQASLDHSTQSAKTVPEGELYVMGDNRANSNDSRNWGTLKLDQVVGKAWLSYWPPQSWGLILDGSP